MSLLFLRQTICVQHMVKMSYDVVKRWVNEAQEAASSDNIMVQVDGACHRKTSCCCVCRYGHGPEEPRASVQAKENKSPVQTR